jgi:hypothetical protein
MRQCKSVMLSVAVALLAMEGQSSTLTLSIEHHIAVVRSEGTQKLLRASFTDGALIADVKLDVYSLPQMPYTRAHLEELQRLSPKTWWRELQWDVRNSAGERQSLRPRLVTASVRERGPNAPNAADRDTSVPCTSYQGTFDLGQLEPGDYTLQVEVHGLQSSRFPLAVRTGSELEVRDVYLQKKARAARDWTEFKTLELERLQLDPTKAAALLELAQRSLEFGTLEETSGYFDRAATTMEQNILDWSKVNPADARKQAAAVETAVAQIRSLVRVLPDYFAHRREWRITVDGTTGQYLIVTRDAKEIIRRVE